ncbi:hypothetical protein JR316_0012989 [Psilocybe cubensis]|uniref:Uncharacterized protein n=2 Tax=Psilocybe cubensis TaxID=181762 RepID=A0A8H7XQL4_PSICU|nr:hypothetical protein JR316_0012989 [Psilocybe cubensis]KAH9474528.1 hypothetical protein JR316_0012989 [Psilocybe cubensis]
MSDSYASHSNKDGRYGLHFYYGNSWDNRTSEPAMESDVQVPACTTTTTRTSSAIEWSADAVRRTLPFNQIPLHRPPEFYEASIQETSTLGDIGRRSENGVSVLPESYQPSLRSSGDRVTERHPMSYVSRLPTHGALPHSGYVRLNPLRYAHLPLYLQQALLYEPTEEELAERAHQPVPPEKLSKYSELSPHLEFMQRLKLEEMMEKKSRNLAQCTSTAAAAVLPSNAPRSPNDIGDAIAHPRSVSQSTHGTSHTSNLTATPAPLPNLLIPDAPPPKKRRRSKQATGKMDSPLDDTMEVDQSSNPATDLGGLLGNGQISPISNSSGEIKYIKLDPRKGALACTFCRERKISCGRPPPGSPDQTCNVLVARSIASTPLTYRLDPSPKARPDDDADHLRGALPLLNNEAIFSGMQIKVTDWDIDR